MKKVVYLALAVATAALSLPACKPDTAKTATNAAASSPASPAAVRAQFDILRDTANVEWQRMIARDDQKLTDAKALLAEVARQPGVSTVRVDSLRQATAQLQAQRYTRQSMADSPLIDRYDAAQSAVLHSLYQVAAPDGNAPTERIRNYVEAIQQADTDANVALYRSHYDRAAKAYNAYLQVHGEELSKMGGKYAGLQPLALFEVQ
ncbi:MAG: hypothetical protein ACRYFX_16750 [Janthinobacterium lividum]